MYYWYCILPSSSARRLHGAHTKFTAGYENFSRTKIGLLYDPPNMTYLSFGFSFVTICRTIDICTVIGPYCSCYSCVLPTAQEETEIMWQLLRTTLYGPPRKRNAFNIIYILIFSNIRLYCSFISIFRSRLPVHYICVHFLLQYNIYKGYMCVIATEKF